VHGLLIGIGATNPSRALVRLIRGANQTEVPLLAADVLDVYDFQTTLRMIVRFGARIGLGSREFVKGRA
jgi:hypothetical protein